MRRLLSEAPVARLATVDREGHPHLVPFVFVLDGDVLYSEVDDKPKRSTRLKRVENMLREPRVAVLADHYEDDWTRLWWVMVRGRARVLEEGAERDRAVALLAEKYEQYDGSPPPGPVIAIDIERWSGWSWGRG